MNQFDRAYSEETADFVFEWVKKWGKLSSILQSLLSHFDSPPFSLPSVNLDEAKYQCLRSWLTKHEAEFIPLWKDFYESQEWAVNPCDEAVADMPDASEYIENPFHFAYKLESLAGLVHSFESQIWLEVETTKPIEQRAWESAVDLVNIDTRVIEFLGWIEQRSPDN